MAPQPAAPNPLLDTLDITPHPRPFKNPNWKPAARRNKSLKQILSDASRTTSNLNTPGANTPLLTAAPPPEIQGARVMAATYANIESPPSLHPGRGAKWCDVTGLPAKYTDPKSKLRYVDKEVFKIVREMGGDLGERYLALRGANVVLK
ncbi:hypothetical protein RUND412_000317 [Rhizina undulata]